MQLSLLTYISAPHNGTSPTQTCVNIIENISNEGFSTELFLPRYTKLPPANLAVKQSLAEPLRRLPWRYVRRLGLERLHAGFAKAIDKANPANTIVYFWPDHPTWLLERAKARGLITVREMINTYRGVAKRILDEAYENQGISPSHGITDQSVDLERRQLALYDFVFASCQIANSLKEVVADRSKILTTSFGWDPRRFPGERSSHLASGFTALFVGMVSIRKGVVQMLEAWRKSGVAGVLKIAGAINPDTLPLIEPYRNDSSIEFLGFRQDVDRLYKLADIFIFPSFEEGDPQVVHEAAGCGLPVIATPMGAGSIVRDGVNGVVVRPYDVDGLARAIRELAASPAGRRRLGEQGQADAAQFTFARIGRKRACMLRESLAHRAHEARRQSQPRSGTAV